MSDVLKPCAHCGDTTAYVGKDELYNTFVVICPDYECGASVGSFVREAEAIAAWNRRTIPTIPVIGKIGDERPASPAHDPLGR